jgi:xanthine dehydrogenase accessory factor
MSSDIAEILSQAENWRRAGRRAALATVVETWGSAPRPVGSHLAINDAGLFVGSVSGGCVEGDVVTAALDVIEDGSPRLLDFGVADETAWRAGLSCGGRIRVYVESLGLARLELLHAMNSEQMARRLCALVTPLDAGEPRFVRADEVSADALSAVVEEKLLAGKSGLAECDEGRFFIETHPPPPRLIMIGAVHVTQSLAAMAGLAGFDVVIVDPRAAFTARERFPDARVLTQWPEEALPSIGLDQFTAVATLAHDPRIDDLALRLALTSDCFYIGALGSKRTHARRVERLLADGIEPCAVTRLHAPIGLDIGAASPAEIAVSILSEIILALRGKPARSRNIEENRRVAHCSRRAAAERIG